jgi:hypothetical protein
MPNIKIPLLREKATHPSLNAAIMINDLARSGIEAFALLHGVLLDEVAEGNHGRETVGELHEAHGGCQAREPEEIGDGGGQDECNGPVDGDDACPKNLTAAGQERGCVEELHEEVVVENLDADVAVECCCDEAADDCKDITYDLPAVGRDALI